MGSFGKEKGKDASLEKNISFYDSNSNVPVFDTHHTTPLAQPGGAQLQRVDWSCTVGSGGCNLGGSGTASGADTERPGTKGDRHGGSKGRPEDVGDIVPKAGTRELINVRFSMRAL